MKRLAFSLVFGCLITSCCATAKRPSTPRAPACSQFRMPGFEWSFVRRILLVPLANESASPHAPTELQDALAARLQCSGRFEVVLPASDVRVTCLDTVRTNGRFDEAELLRLAAEYQVDAVLFGTVTQYQPYAPLRIGLSLRLISPSDAAVIASVDGLWDARDKSVAEQARSYHSLVLGSDRALLGDDVVLESPHLFQRFACHEAVTALIGPVVSSGTGSALVR